MKEKLKLAILDLYDNTPNQGMRCIKEIVRQYDAYYDWKIFDVRVDAEVPDLSYDLYISSGGPGSPHDGDGIWDKKYFDWLESLWKWNKIPGNNRKFAFFICHSFQMACKHFQIGNVTNRKSKSFGTFPVHMTDEGIDEVTFAGLSNPFFAADFRDYQVIEPDLDRIDEMGASILALEKIRPHVDLERAIMGVRFSPELVGVQFHPEADPEGMIEHFSDPERKQQVIDNFGMDKLAEMILHLRDEDKISLTHNVVLPNFIEHAIQQISEIKVGQH